MSGIKGANNGGGNTIYLKIVGNAIWQTNGNLDKDHPLYMEEEYEFNEETKLRKGYKIGAVTGTLESIFFKESQYGEMMNVYMNVAIDDEGTMQRYCIGFPLSGSWDKHNFTKRMMLALMSLDFSEEFTVNVSKNVGESGFESTNLWVTQFDKNLILNPNADPEKFDPEKQIEMPISVLEVIADVRTPDPEEMKDLTPKRKQRFREDELDDLRVVVEEVVLPTINSEKPDNSEPKSEPKQEEPKDEPKTNGGSLGGGKKKPAPKKDELKEEESKPVRETPRERIERLKKEREARGGK